ncbi:MAG: hypothetical protein JKY92_09355 [Magnetovibrio sp.]|nr:hypothetical protein [Magnetovibrio sp.]
MESLMGGDGSKLAKQSALKRQREQLSRLTSQKAQADQAASTGGGKRITGNRMLKHLNIGGSPETLG